jgi:hypothetical protein
MRQWKVVKHQADFSFDLQCDMKIRAMEKIDPLPDHLRLQRFAIGQPVELRGKTYTVLRRTTLASGEPALVLSGGGEQFVIGAIRFLAGVKENA